MAVPVEVNESEEIAQRSIDELDAVATREAIDASGDHTDSLVARSPGLALAG